MITVEQESTQKRSGVPCLPALLIFVVVMSLAAMALWSVESPVFMCGWIVFFGWLEWFLVFKCGKYPHWWKRGA